MSSRYERSLMRMLKSGYSVWRMTGSGVGSAPCDLVATRDFTKKAVFLIEVKSVRGDSYYLSSDSEQLDDLKMSHPDSVPVLSVRFKRPKQWVFRTLPEHLKKITRDTPSNVLGILFYNSKDF